MKSHTRSEKVPTRSNGTSSNNQRERSVKVKSRGGGELFEDDNVAMVCPPKRKPSVKDSSHRSTGRRTRKTEKTSKKRRSRKKNQTPNKLLRSNAAPGDPFEEEIELVDLERGCVHFVTNKKTKNDHGASGETTTTTTATVIDGTLCMAAADSIQREVIAEPREDLSMLVRSETIIPHFQRKSSLLPAAPSFCLQINHRICCFLRNSTRFRALKISQIVFAIYIMVLTFADLGSSGGLRDTETGYIVDQESIERTQKGLIMVHGDERAIMANSTFQVGCIGLARLSAWFMYPTLVFVFISKFRATTTFLNKSPAAMHMYSDSHELHVYCGWTIIICALVHTSCHIARWAAQRNLRLLINTTSGVTGLIIIFSCLLICIPMTLFRRQIKYEVRKRLHYLFIVFAGALAFHTPRSAVPNGGFTAYIFGGLLLWYFLDATYCYFFMTEKIETTKFAVLPSGVRMTMNVSERFQKVGAKGGICYVCLPWISKGQWHAFSLFENPANPAERQIFIQKTGDWTDKLHRYAQRNTVRPAWVHGPFPSPYDSADAYDNQILVASGIGITPALSVIRAHKDSRRINLIWVVRDPHLLNFFLHHLYLDHEGWNLIFYTGKEKLRMPHMDVLANTNVCVVGGRPNLHEVIPNIIFGIESGQGLPENYTPTTRATASELLADRLIKFNKNESGKHLSTGVADAAAEDLAGFASALGFHLPMEEISQRFDLSTKSNERRLERTRTSKELMSRLSIGFRPWDKQDGAKEYVKGLDKKLVLRTWGILYCGGAKKVLDDLEDVSEDYDICLHVESFEW